MTEENMQAPQGDGVKKDKASDAKICALLAYLVIGIIWFFVDEKMRVNEFAKYHVKQALVLVIASLAGHLVLGLIPILGWVILPIFSLGILALGVIGIINAVNGEKKELPIIGQFADKFKF